MEVWSDLYRVRALHKETLASCRGQVQYADAPKWEAVKVLDMTFGKSPIHLKDAGSGR